jgi:hypothetical protein
MFVRRPCGCGQIYVVLTMVGIILGGPRAALAVTPQSPEVQKLVEKGVAYLEKSSESRLGGQALIAMTLFMVGKDATHPYIESTLKQCQEKAKGEPKDVQEDIYSLGIIVLFLCELAPDQFRNEINFYLKALQERQKPHGGWGYEGNPLGDTSMSQYGVLSAWTARTKGFEVPDEVIEKVANWLIRTQDPSGAWGYWGKDPGTYDKVPQTEIRLSLTTAALGSMLISAKVLDLMDMSYEADDEDLPPALIPVHEEKSEGGAGSKKNVDAHRLRAAVTAGSGWFHNNYRIDPPGFTHYYLYALERFMTVRDLAEKDRSQKRNVKAAPWYDEGYNYLAKTQQEDGSWKSDAGPAVDTAFAILFLIRATQRKVQQIEAVGEGTLVGGRGLPTDTKNVKLRNGRLVPQNQAKAVEDMLKALGDPDEEEDLDSMADAPQEIELSADPKVRNNQLKQLRQVVRTGSPKARLAAIKTLGQSRDVQYVPLMIYALTDPDPHVAVAADGALKFLSRRLDAAAMKFPPDKSAREAAVDRWKEWFLQLYPDLPLEE